AFGRADELQAPRDLVLRQVEDALIGPPSGAAPQAAAVVAGEADHFLVETRRGEHLGEDDVLQALVDEVLVRFGSQVGDVARTEALAREGRREGRKRLRGPGLFAGDGGGRNRTLLDGIEGLAGLAVEEVDPAGL